MTTKQQIETILVRESLDIALEYLNGLHDSLRFFNYDDGEINKHIIRAIIIAIKEANCIFEQLIGEQIELNKTAD